MGRSLRRRTDQKSKENFLQWLQSEKDPPGLEVKPVNDYVGQGLFAVKSFAPGEFVCEYRGDLITSEEAKIREKKNSRVKDYMFGFRHNEKQWCIDAFSSSAKARFANDGISEAENITIKKIVLEKPHLCLFAKKHIHVGDELRYDYGYTDAEWRKIKEPECEKIYAVSTGVKIAADPQKTLPSVELMEISIAHSDSTGGELLEILETFNDMGESSEDRKLFQGQDIENNADDYSHGDEDKEVEDTSHEDYGSPRKRQHSESEDSIVPGSVDSDVGDRLVRLEISKPSSMTRTDPTNYADDRMDTEEVEDSDKEDISDEEYHPKKRQHRGSKNSFMLNCEERGDENGLDCLDDSKPSSMTHTDPTNLADDRMDSEGSEVGVSICSNNDTTRVYDNLHACLYCDKMISCKMKRHMMLMHNDEREVKAAMAIPNNKEKQAAFDRLRLRGNHFYNVKALQMGQGNLLVMRRPKQGMEHKTDEYMPCPDCLGYIYKKDLWKHRKVCIATSEKKEDSCGKKHLAESRQVLSESLNPKTANTLLHKKVFSLMVNDSIKLIAKNDPLICAFGDSILSRVGCAKSTYVSCKMREVSRLLLSLREADADINNLQDAIDPSKFDTVIGCVKAVCKFSMTEEDANPGMFHTPSLALKLGYSLKSCASLLKAKAVASMDNVTIDKVDKYLYLHECKQTGFSVQISSPALKTMYVNKEGHPELLPVANDLLMLRNHLESEIQKNYLSLVAEVEDETYFALLHSTAARVILFNKRRGGEAMRLKVTSYRNRPDWDCEDITQSLSTMEKELRKRLDMVKTPGKRGRMVPILLTSAVKRAIDLLLETREQVNINPENQYVFAMGGQSLQNLRGWDVLHTAAVDAGLQRPDLITSTKLRKYVATVSQIIDLNENELEWLSSHMGHSIKVHRQFYRLQSSVLEMAKVGKLLCAIDNGELHKFSNKTLADITLSDIPSVEDEEADETEEASVEKDRTEELDRERDDREEKEREDSDVDSSVEGSTAMNTMKRTYKRMPWTSQEKKALWDAFGQFIKTKTVPGKADIERVMNISTEFNRRSWKNVKDAVRNIIAKTEKH